MLSMEKTAASYPIPREENPGSHQYWLAKGEHELQANRAESANQCFNRALALDPFSAEAYNNCAVLHWGLNQTEEALLDMTKALELEPNNAQIVVNCSGMFRRLGKLKDAREILENYTTHFPWDNLAQDALKKLDGSSAASEQPASVSQMLNDLGERKFEEGRVDHAQACFEMAIDQEPADGRSHGNLGVVYWQQGNLDRALAHFLEALEHSPDDANLLCNSAKALAAAGQFENAVELMKMYLKKCPQDDAAWDDYSSLLSQKNQITWQPDSFGPEVADIYLETSRKLLDSNDLAGAAQAVERALLIAPEKADSYLILGRLHSEIEQPGEELNILREGLRAASGKREIVLKLGELLCKSGERDEAISVYQSYLQEKEDEEIEKLLQGLTENGGGA